jgi:hypothetical protein
MAPSSRIFSSANFTDVAFVVLSEKSMFWTRKQLSQENFTLTWWQIRLAVFTSVGTFSLHVQAKATDIFTYIVKIQFAKDMGMCKFGASLYIRLLHQK